MIFLGGNMEEFIKELSKANKIMYLFQDTTGNNIETMIEDCDSEMDDSYIYISGLHGVCVSIFKKPISIKYEENCYVLTYANSEISVLFR